MPIIADSKDKDCDNQDNVNSNDNKVYQTNQQFKGGVETEPAEPEELPVRVNTCG